MRDYMDMRATPPNRVTSPTWGSLPPCKQVHRDAFPGIYILLTKKRSEDLSSVVVSAVVVVDRFSDQRCRLLT